ncbi:MAG: PQQ-binding-like beta-propeller repeat protein [Candidatus Micrarchaeia archaeon]
MKETKKTGKLAICPKVKKFLVIVMLMACISSADSYEMKGDWEKFHNHLNNDGFNAGVAIMSPITTKWTYLAGEYITSSPAVVNGIVYFGSGDGNVYALKARTGKKIWSYLTGNQISFSSPAVKNGIVYIGSVDGNVYALNANNGRKIWSYYTAAMVLSSPAVSEGIIYSASAANDSEHYSYVYALNASTGNLVWKYATNGPIQTSSPAVAEGTVYIGSQDSNGTGGDKFYALNAYTGKRVWSCDIGAVDSSPAVANGMVYVASHDWNVYALNSSTGEKIWRFNTYSGGMGYGGISSPAIADGKVYIGEWGGNFYALNASNGELIWNYSTSESIISSPAVVGGVVYFGTQTTITNPVSRNIYALDAENGQKIWNYTTEEAILSSPAIVEGVLYVGSSSGKVYAITQEPNPEQNPITTQASDSNNSFEKEEYNSGQSIENQYLVKSENAGDRGDMPIIAVAATAALIILGVYLAASKKC